MGEEWPYFAPVITATLPRKSGMLAIGSHGWFMMMCVSGYFGIVVIFCRIALGMHFWQRNNEINDALR